MKNNLVFSVVEQLCLFYTFFRRYNFLWHNYRKVNMSTPKTIIHLIAAARPNFMKVAPLYHALKQEDWCVPLIVHTGQHYDENMSASFLRDLNLPDPDSVLGVGSGTHAEQTAGVMLAYEKVCLERPPDYIVVVGDVNSTMAVAITAAKLRLPVAHLEAGLRSGDRTMPEEINRIVTDSLCDLLWTPSSDADEHLRKEGIPEEKIARVGNIMMDSYEMLREKIEAENTWERLGLTPGGYGVVTLHRPSNVDREETLKRLVAALVTISSKLPLIFPVHPRTRKSLTSFDLQDELDRADGITTLEPMGYIPFMNLVDGAKLVITDSGGIQEETTYLGIPCLTVRENTERPVTITQGTNKLVSVDTMLENVDKVLAGGWPQGKRPELWDGHTAKRVVESLKNAVAGHE
jgi:UDP-N-acetylglucosamine 2-epimerase (non-hydrolysing)